MVSLAKRGILLQKIMGNLWGILIFITHSLISIEYTIQMTMRNKYGNSPWLFSHFQSTGMCHFANDIIKPVFTIAKHVFANISVSWALIEFVYEILTFVHIPTERWKKPKYDLWSFSVIHYLYWSNVMVFVSVKVKFIVVIIIIDLGIVVFFWELINSIHNLYQDIYWGRGVCSLVLMT